MGKQTQDEMLLCSNELLVVQSPQNRRLRQPAIAEQSRFMSRRPLETNFDEFFACSDAEAVFGDLVCVSVIVAPRGILLVVHIANDRHRDQNDGYADD